MSERVWLASYPKSGNTWMRILISCLSLKDDEALDINAFPQRGGIASARRPFDDLTLIDSGLLTHDEIDRLRPRLYEDLAQRLEEEITDESQEFPPVQFVKVHDAYTMTSLGEPLLAGERGAKAAIVIVRDPRDVAPSFANHNGTTIDQAIAFMNNIGAAFCDKPGRQHSQVRQHLPGWSGHVASWLDQQDIPVVLVRYEALQRDTAAIFHGAMELVGRPVSREAVERAVELADFSRLRAQEREVGFAEASRSDHAFFRRGEAGAWRDELTADQVVRIESAHGPMMRRMGYQLSAKSELARAG